MRTREKIMPKILTDIVFYVLIGARVKGERRAGGAGTRVEQSYVTRKSRAALAGDKSVADHNRWRRSSRAHPE